MEQKVDPKVEEHMSGSEAPTWRYLGITATAVAGDVPSIRRLERLAGPRRSICGELEISTSPAWVVRTCGYIARAVA